MPKKSVSISRRRFLAASTAFSVPLIVPASVLGRGNSVAPSERITFGSIGVGNRALGVIPHFIQQADVQYVAVSDCRADRLKAARKLVGGQHGSEACRAYPDFRELLAQDDIDAVFIATGDRWHSLATSYAARAGKDVYCEKPISLSLLEGRRMVETCQRYGAIYQAGHQRRSVDSYRFAAEVVQKGMIGNLQTVEMQVWRANPIPHAREEPVPEGWDYDTWLGPTPWKPFVPAHVNGWNYFWDTGAGMIAAMGCHYTDLMQMALQTDDTGPVEFEGQAEWPDPVKFYSDTPISGEVRCKYANGVTGVMVQRRQFNDRYIRYIGDEGWIQVDDATNRVTAEPESILSLRGVSSKSWSQTGGHIRNLLDSIRSRKPTVCEPETAHRAMSICQLMNICLRLGRKITWNPATERVVGDDEANRMLWRAPRSPWIV